MKKIFCFILLLISHCFLYSNNTVGLEVGNIIKPFTIYEYPSNKEFTENKFKGKMTILNFGTTWCSVCLEEKKNLDNFIKNNKNLDINVVPILIDSKENIKKYLTKEKFDYTFYEDKNMEVGNKFLIRGVPMTFILDENGVIIYKHLGAINLEDIKSIFEGLKEE